MSEFSNTPDWIIAELNKILHKSDEPKKGIRITNKILLAKIEKLEKEVEQLKQKK